MAYEYERVATPTTGLRLHLNENTAGCSPQVLAALQALTREEIARYPDYVKVEQACAARLEVPVDRLVLTNGLDEAVLSISVAALRGSDRETPQAIVVTPAFEMYGACSNAAGGVVVEVPCHPDFEFPVERVLAALTSATRLVFINTPNNPTGRSVPRDAILRVAEAAPRATIFVDEAYVDFSGDSLIGNPELTRLRNVIVGRTFSKAYGLAGLRTGVLIGQPEALAPIRRVIPPYSLNVCAAVAVGAALEDEGYYEWYVGQVLASKGELYRALDRLNVRYWRSDANFVLADFGRDARRVVRELARRQVHVRDKSRDPACPNCIRITTGVVEHTRACIAALEEILCEAAS